MPRGDKTGPQGQGPLTGRNMGPCSGNKKQDPTPGQGQSRRKGVRTGLGNVFGQGRKGGQRGKGQGQGRRGRGERSRNK